MWDLELQNTTGTVVVLLVFVLFALYKQHKHNKGRNRFTDYRGGKNADSR